jgi:hypothetical protein
MTDKITASRFALFRYLTVIVPALVGLIVAVVGAGGTGGPHPGDLVDLRVSGDNVALAGPAWPGPATLAGGLLLLALGGYLFIRARRRSTSD